MRREDLRRHEGGDVLLFFCRMENLNRLGREKSPYLLQHRHNPVDWFAWGDEAFAKARSEDKPIFLSIGYSTCHWCHVMERESFEDAKVAEFLNAHFVSIKVDREERPDVDKIYMTAVQSLTGQGGWPLNCFLTPDLKPFYGGTYFPPESRYGRASFRQLLTQIANLWQTKREHLVETAADFHEQLGAHLTQAASQQAISPQTLDHATELFKREYDAEHGGFGGEPKFPRPAQPAFLLRDAARTADKEAVEMVLRTCERMAAGGINDQLGGGFARYSVDAKWLVPHFEKMLYDNAQLVNLYLDAYLVSGEEAHAKTAREIIGYVLRDMTHAEGGFYSAEDADSEGKEGKFYCWTKEELRGLLTAEEFAVATRYFGVTEGGNFVDHSDPEPLPNQNVLSIVDAKLSEKERTWLESAKGKMFEARSRRVRPHLDDKILASWNGMMLGALARGFAVLGEESYRVAAETGTLYHRWRDGERDSVQLLTGYANLLAGTIDLYEATLEAGHLEFALKLAESMMARFYDAEQGGFYNSAAGVSDLILRVKEDYDGAEPSGNSVAVLALWKLAAIAERKDFREAAEKTLRLFARRMNELPQAVPLMLQALDATLTEPHRVVAVGEKGDARTAELLRAAHSVYQPNKVVLGNSGPVEAFAKTLPVGKEPVVFICTGSACQAPTSEAKKIQKALRG
jgi:uncharacterized protein YyaL (SSP411 family)